MKRFLVNIGLACFATALAIGVTVVGVKSDIRMITSSEFDEWLQESNEAWAKAGYTTINDSSGVAATSPKSSNSSSDAKKVKACDHTYEDKVTKEPTCSEPGEMISTCTKCGDSYKTELPATEKHNYEATVTMEATCTSNGEVTYTCTDCGDTYTEVIPATGHTYDSSVTKKETCTEEGIMTYICAACGDTYTEVIAFLGHVPGEWLTSKEAGWFSAGEAVQTCTKCGEIITTKVIPSIYPVSLLYGIVAAICVAVAGLIVVIVLKKKRRI